jgi:hypothetical protein
VDLLAALFKKDLELEDWEVYDKEKVKELTWLLFDKVCWTLIEEDLACGNFLLVLKVD